MCLNSRYVCKIGSCNTKCVARGIKDPGKATVRSLLLNC